MEDLTKQKQEIVERYQSSIFAKRAKINEDILTLMDKALKDGQITAKVHVSILDKIKGGGEIQRSSQTNMDGAQQLELAKMYFMNIEFIMNTITNDLRISGYESLLKNIDDQIQLAMDEIKQIDEELKIVTDASERAKLQERKGKAKMKK